MYSYNCFVVPLFYDIASSPVLLKSALSRKHNFRDGRILRFLSRKELFSTLNKLDALMKILTRELREYFILRAPCLLFLLGFFLTLT